MARWDEDTINAELRHLTGELKRLREELRDMVEPPKPSASRAFLHRQSWPTAIETADDRPMKHTRKPKRQKQV